MQIALIYCSTVIAYSIRNIKGEIVASLFGCDLQQLGILLLRQMLLKVHVQG